MLKDGGCGEERLTSEELSIRAPPTAAELFGKKIQSTAGGAVYLGCLVDLSAPTQLRCCHTSQVLATVMAK